MHPRLALCGILLAITPAVLAQEPDLSKVEIQATQLSDNLYLLQGAGGNLVASVGADAVLLVDDEFAPLADKIRASLKGLGADRPVRFVINTHYHSDINAGGSVQGMIRACEDVLKSVPARTKVVPGHGDLSDVDGLREYLRMLRDTTAVIARALKAGETLDHMKKARLLGAWSERYSPPKAFIDTDAFTETLYYSLKPRAGAAGAR